jgi:ATP phosphoribosyltransferase
MMRMVVPSDGELYQATQDFLGACGLAIERNSHRQYTAIIPSLKDSSVLFQRATDITLRVEDGSSEMGIVGLDRYMEYHKEDGDTLILIDDLGFGSCDLVIAVPDGWADVMHMSDLADMSIAFREKGSDLRVATKYPRLVQNYLFANGVNYFSLVSAGGTLEAAPAMEYADVIADISVSGATLRENRLRILKDGIVYTSQACLIGNKQLLGESNSKLDTARIVLERMEAYLRAGEFYSITANIQSGSAETIASKLMNRPDIAGIKGPTVSKVYSMEDDDWYSVTVVVAKELIMEAVDHLRSIGGSGLTVTKPNYIFNGDCQANIRLLQSLNR